MPGMLVHTYNLSYSGSRGQSKFKASLGKGSTGLHFKNKLSMVVHIFGSSHSEAEVEGLWFQDSLGKVTTKSYLEKTGSYL
jgi:hypothetical protein